MATLAAAGLIATQVIRSSSDSSGGLDRFELKASDVPGYKKAAGVISADGCSRRVVTRAALRRLRAIRVAGCSLAKWRRADGAPVFLVAYSFDEASSASAALPKLRKDFVADSTDSDGVKVLSKHSLAVSGLGNEAPRGVRVELSGGSQRASTFTYWWRRDKVVATLAMVDAVGPRAALALADRIDERATR